MPPKVLRRRDATPGVGLRAVLAAQSQTATSPAPITAPPEDAEAVKNSCDSFLLDSFGIQDAWELGHLLYARLLPLSGQKPAVVSIALASGQVVFQAAVGSGTAPDNETWVQRKFNSALRFGCSTWYLHCKYQADEQLFRAKSGLGPEQAGKYSIHGGAVPIRVEGVEGVVAVVVLSGLRQHEDHGVIFDVVASNWE